MLGESDKAYFADLFVRASNTPAIKMSEKASDDFLLANLYTNLAPLLVEIIWVFYFDKVYTLIRSILAYNMQIGFPLMSQRAEMIHILLLLSQLGYVIDRRVLRYYSGEEDGLDMRKASSRDIEKKSITGV
ncbi:hypothetical protein OIU76_006879 [Salix suchowensis]|nr:hypothetical protein OIU76_006879 [Salix suchowensis]